MVAEFCAVDNSLQIEYTYFPKGILALWSVIHTWMVFREQLAIVHFPKNDQDVLLVFLFLLYFKNWPSPTLQKHGVSLPFLNIFKWIASRYKNFQSA